MTSKLLQSNPLEAENQFELSLRESFELLKPQLKPPFPLTIPSPSEYKKLNQALLFALLTEPHHTKIHLTHLHAIVTDGYAFFVSLLLKIAFELYPKLLESVKIQFVCVIGKLIEVSAVGVEGLLICLMRQIVGGDFSDGNLWLCVEVLRFFSQNWDWLLEEPLLLTSALFTYLRILADHNKLPGQRYEALKRMEIDFCVRVLRNHFNLCLRIGRDLVRLLQDLLYIPEFKDIGKDLLLNPGAFGVDGFTDISQLYCWRTSSRYLLLRVTPEMETQLRFLLSHVKWGFQQRYQAWFFRKFLSRPGSETVITDIVRFICCAHHPPNEIIQSNVIPRWAVIGWLLKACGTSEIEGSVKLALLYDWMFYNEMVDNIMNIEPGILLMVHSMPKYIDMTHTLLEFLFHLIENYDLQRKDIIFRGVSSAFNVLVKRGVVHSMEVFFSSPILSPLVKAKLAKIFSKSANAACLPQCFMPPLNLVRPSNLEIQTSVLTKVCHKENGINTSPVLETSSVSGSPRVIPKKSPIDIMENLVRRLGESIKCSNDLSLRTLEELLFAFANYSSESRAGAPSVDSILHPETLAGRVTEAFRSNGYDMFVPLRSSPKFYGDDEIHCATTLFICTSIFCQHSRIQELICFWSKNGYQVSPLFLSYASRLAYEAEKIGCSITRKRETEFIQPSKLATPLLKYHIDEYVTYMNARADNCAAGYSASGVDKKLITELVHCAFTSYKGFLMSSNKDDTSLTKLLFSDLMSCCKWEKERLQELLCTIFYYLPDLSTCKEEFFHLLMENMDYGNLVSLQFEVSLECVSMFGEDPDVISHIIKSSLNWGFVEQQKFWALMASEQAISKTRVQKLVTDFFHLGVLDPNVHSVAIGGLFTLCSRLAPTPELVSTMVSLPDNTFEGFAPSVLANWVVSNSSMLFNSLGKCLEQLETDGNSAIVASTGDRLNHLIISRFLNFLEKQGKQCTDCVNKLSVSIPEIKAKLSVAAAAHAVR